MADQEFVLFYAWQSDRSARDHRNFVEGCAEKALKQLASAGSLELAPRLDKDTQGIPGMPDIANTILAKIDAASAFLADITFVGQAPRDNGEGKKLPNPNVLLELGYAVSRLGWDRVLCVMNTFYGVEEDLPFDLRHRRWPIKYSLAPDADDATRTEVRQKLVKDLHSGVLAISSLGPTTIKATVVDRLGSLETSVTDLASSIARIMSELAQRRESPETRRLDDRTAEVLDSLVARTHDGTFNGVRAVQGMMALAILPASAPPRKIDFPQHEHELALKLRPLYAMGWDHRYHGARFSTFSASNGEIDAASEISADGIIAAVGHNVVAIHPRALDGLRIPADVHAIPSVAYEKSLIEAVQKYLTLLSYLGIPGPWSLGVRLFDLKHSVLIVRPGYSYGHDFVGDGIAPDPVEIPGDVNLEDPQRIAALLRPIFDYIWREHGFPRSFNYAPNGEWVGQ